MGKALCRVLLAALPVAGFEEPIGMTFCCLAQGTAFRKERDCSTLACAFMSAVFPS